MNGLATSSWLGILWTWRFRSITGDNLDRRRLRELTGQPAAPTTPLHRPTLPQWLQERMWILQDRTRFFRRGSGGAGREALDSTEPARYYARAIVLAPSDLLDWLHRPALEFIPFGFSRHQPERDSRS